MHEVIEAARKVTGHHIPIEIAHRRAGDPAVLVASAKKAEGILGWQRNFPGIEEIVATAWTLHKERHAG